MRKGIRLKCAVTAVCMLLSMLLTPTPVYAWKPKTHVFSANLILEEIQANNGYLVFPYYGKIKVQDDYLSAILTYPDYFRAGAIGPDAFPDIYVGQVFAHPTTNIKAGEWIKYLTDQMKKLPAASTERKQVLAFVLGYTVHESGDLFGHSFVNLWAEGPWPDISNGISDNDMKIIVRHNVIEEYIDKQIPQKFAAPSYNTISIPKSFIYNNMVTNGKSPDYDNASSDALDINPVYSRTGSLPKHFDMFYSIRKELKNGIATRASYNPVRIYEEYWLKDIDEGMLAWLDTSENVARDLLLPADGLTQAKEELSDWAIDHFLSMVGFPDVAGTVINAIGSISDLVASIIPDFLNELIDEMKNSFYDVIFQMAFDMKYTQMKAILDDPSGLLNDTNYFKLGSEARLKTALNNFPSATTTAGHSFHPFSNTLIMAKINLIGQQGMDELLRLADLQYVGSSPYPPICFINSLDVGYNWDDIGFQGLNIWDDQRARAQIFNNIFNAETSKYQWLSKKEREVLDAFNSIMTRDPSPDEMGFYSQMMDLGWKKPDVENDLRQLLANDAQLQQIRRETEIMEQKLAQDTTLGSLVPGKGRAVYKALNLNGKKLTVNCNLEITRNGMIDVSGGTLVVNGDLIIHESSVMGGILNIGRGTVIVHGSMKMRGGLLDVSKGKLDIKGTYALSYVHKPLPGSTGPYASLYNYDGGTGILQMKESEGQVMVGGNFVTCTRNSHENYLTAGTLEVKGDFYQARGATGCRIENGEADLFLEDAAKSRENDRYNFKALSLHKVLFSGGKVQNVGLAITGPNESQFSILEITNPTEVKFVTKVTVSGLFKHNGKNYTLTDPAGSSFPDYDGDGQRDNLDSNPCPDGDPTDVNETVNTGNLNIIDKKPNPRDAIGDNLPLLPHLPGLPEVQNPLVQEKGTILLPDPIKNKPIITGSKLPAIIQDWNGTWYTTYGEVKFDPPMGDQVIGHYYNNVGTLTGTVSLSDTGKAVLKGTYIEGSGDDIGKGFFEFTLSTDKQSFTGFWRNEEDDPLKQIEWNGDRATE